MLMLITSRQLPTANRPAAPDFSTVGEKVLDDQTLQVTLRHPVPFFPSLCAFPPFFPMYEPAMRPFGTTDPKRAKPLTI